MYDKRKPLNHWSALCASQPANAAVNPACKLKLAADLAADTKQLGHSNV
jgi:hypothetical protein